MFLPSGIADVSVANPPVDVQVVGAGQSWTNLWQNTSFMYGIVSILQVSGAGNVFCNLTGYGGSAILQAHERGDATPGTFYWCSNPSASYPGTWTDGPLLTSAKAAINSRLAKGPTPIGLVWQQKEQDTMSLDMSSAAAARAEATLWRYGSFYAMAQLGEQWAPGNGNGIFRYVHFERRMNNGLAAKLAVTRDAQFDLIAMNATRILPGAENYDIPYPDNDDHPALYDCYHPGMRMGLAVANASFGGSYPTGPSIGSITRGAANRLDIAINVEGGQTLRKPTAPVGFRVFPGNDYLNSDGTTKTPIPITGYAWVGNTLQLTLATTGQATVCYPWLDAGDLIYRPGGSETTVIRYSSKVTERDIGLPLRSIKAATVAA